MLRDIKHPIYDPGQVWLAPKPDGSVYRVVLLKLEYDPRQGALAHVRVEGVQIPLPDKPGQFGDTLGHAPFTVNALGRSNLSYSGQDVRLGESDLEGYHTWRAAFERGESGVFTLTVQEAVDSVAESMRTARMV